ncbi:ATP-binding cassette domain-containing protein [Calditrichota bacterium]
MNYQITITKSDQNLINIDNFKLENNKINFLLGESGIGKTMLAKTIFGLLDNAQFKIIINGKNYSHYLKEQKNKKFQKDGFFVFQEPSTHFNPLLKIGTQLKEGSLATGKKEKEILEQLWINPKENYLNSLVKIFPKPYRPSGGEKQRFLLAMAFKRIDYFLSNHSGSDPLFIFDEPSGNLDDLLRNKLLKLLFYKYRQKSFTVLFITHDYSIISEVATNHKILNKSIVFNELVRENSSVNLKLFNVQNYLYWLHSAHHFKQKSTNKLNKVLLQLENEVSVFNKKIKIYKDVECKQLTPLAIHQNEIVYLKAPSGTGKTTIAKIIMGLIRADKFEINIDGTKYDQDTDLKKWKNELWGKKLTMTFQHADESLNLKSTVKQILLNLPRTKRPSANELISNIKMIYDSEIDESFFKKNIWQLSGGQKQRLNLLRALLLDTPILILDEPLNGLDFSRIKRIIDLLFKKKEEGTGILIISHNEEIIDTIVDDTSIYYLSQN